MRQRYKIVDDLFLFFYISPPKRGDERLREEGISAKKDREEGERTKKLERREKQHKKGGRRCSLKNVL